MSTPSQRRAKRRKTLPGFPWEGQFQSTEDAKKYPGKDSIQCLCCGKLYRALNGHINLIHDMDESAYKLRFGIPYGVPLCSLGTSNKHSELGNPSVFDDYRTVSEDARRQAKCRPIVQSVHNQRSDRINTVIHAPHVISSCKRCGSDVTANPFSKVLCQACREADNRLSEDDRKRISDWSVDNADRAAAYQRARAFWSWKKNPFPLLEYAEKYGAKLRSMKALLDSAKEMK